MNIYNFIIFLIVALLLLSKPKIVYAAENPTETIMAGAEVVMYENMEALAYKEMVKLSTLLITDPVLYMEEYNRIQDVYKDYLTPTNSIYDAYSEEDIKYLQRCVETETHGCQVFIDKVHIADVILNRVKDDTERFPDSIKEVVTASEQFAYGKSTIDPLTVAACEYAYLNADTTSGALWFHSGKKTNTFNGGQYLFTDDTGHHFYR